MLIPIVLSGGAGSRLWPLSRKSLPKPFIQMEDGGTLYGKTIQRLLDLGVDDIITVTNRDYYFISKDGLEELGAQSAQKNRFLLETVGRNTAPAIAISALLVAEVYGDDTTMLVLPSDHLIKNDDAFQNAILEAAALAEQNKLVTIGLLPSRPETGYGYIECGENYGGASYAVNSFVEKPELEVAQKLLASGRHYWNSGMFCFKASAILKAFENLAPEVYRGARECWSATCELQETDTLLDAIALHTEFLEKLPDISIDYAVMEKADNVAMVAGDFEWNDIGCWNAFGNAHEADESGNTVIGHARLLDVKNSFIRADGRTIAAIGLEDLIVVDTPDALLIADKARAQDVKEIVTSLKDEGHDCAVEHKTILRPWGSYTVIEEGPGFKMKRIVVKQGASLSLQMHNLRAEHWVVVEGIADVINGDDEFLLHENESTYIPKMNKHRLSNVGDGPLVIIEVQTGDYLGEDDIVRFDDVYGRAQVLVDANANTNTAMGI